MEEKKETKIVKRKCYFCKKERNMNLTKIEDCGWVKYIYKCYVCGKVEEFEYDETRR